MRAAYIGACHQLSPGAATCLQQLRRGTIIDSCWPFVKSLHIVIFGPSQVKAGWWYKQIISHFRECNIILFSVTIFPSWTEDDTIKMSSGLSADILCAMTVTMLWSPRHPGYHPSLPVWCWPAEVVKISLHYTSPVPVWNCDSSTPVQCTLHPSAILLKWWWVQNNSLFHQAYGIHPSSYLFCIAQLLMAVVKHLTSQH